MQIVINGAGEVLLVAISKWEKLLVGRSHGARGPSASSYFITFEIKMLSNLVLQPRVNKVAA